jgi:hypothetical protein
MPCALSYLKIDGQYLASSNRYTRKRKHGGGKQHEKWRPAPCPRAMRASRPPSPLPPQPPPHPRALRIFALGTLFVTHTLALPAPACPGTSTRASAVRGARGGGAPGALRALAQLPGAAPELVVPLGGDAEAAALRREVEVEGVGTRYCRVWAGRGVPGAWVLQHGMSDGCGAGTGN